MIKIKDITPPHMACAIGPCPAVYETERGTLLIVGRRADPELRGQIPPGKVAPDEDVIEVSRELISDVGKR